MTVGQGTPSDCDAQVGKLGLALYLHAQPHTILMIKDGDMGKVRVGCFRPWTSTMYLTIYLHILCHRGVVIEGRGLANI
jgi:hypothetical protein